MSIEDLRQDLLILEAERQLMTLLSSFPSGLHLESLHMDDKPHKFVMQDHWRGRGMHIDHRWEREVGGSILDGMTIAVMKPGIAKEEINTVVKAKEMLGHDEYYKITNEPSRLRMFADEKKSEPREWLTVEGIVEPGEVGATRYEYGVFVIRTKGIQYLGAQKPFFKELFLESPKYNGRFVYRQIERRKPETAKQAWLWQFGKPLDQSPYVLSRRAVTDAWVPPWKVSCLPPSIRAQISTKYKYWEQRDYKARLQIRDALRKALLRKEVRIKLEEKLPASLQHHWWKKRVIIRVGPSEEHWDLRIRVARDKPLLHFILTKNPLETDEWPIGAIEKACKDHAWLYKGFPKEYIAPGKPGNPTPDTPAWVEGLDRGTATIFERSALFMKIGFQMKRLKGLYVFKRTSAKSPYWRLQKSELPEPK